MGHSSNPSARVCKLVDLRDGNRCVRCGKTYCWAGFSRHHRHNRSHPFKRLHEASNLILLCGSGSSPHCHAWCHEHPKEAQQYGWIVSGFNDHPERIPVFTYLHGWVLLDDSGGWVPCQTFSTV